MKVSMLRSFVASQRLQHDLGVDECLGNIQDFHRGK